MSPLAVRLYGDEGGRIAGLVAEVLPGTWSEVAILAEPHRADARVFLGQVGARDAAFALLRVVLDEAELRAEGCSAVHLEVRSSNLAARRFYEAVGFAEIGARRGYYEAPPDDAIVMKRQL